VKDLSAKSGDIGTLLSVCVIRGESNGYVKEHISRLLKVRDKV
jgi:hypothetical protein